MQQVPLSLKHVSRTLARLAAMIGPAVLLCAQTPALQLSTVYQCPGGKSFKVFSCSGPGDTASCDVQGFEGAQPVQRGPAPRAQVMVLLQVCRALKPGEAPSAAAAPPGGSQQADVNGFKVGDTVQINTAFGWMDAKILAVNGNNYRVHAQSGADVTKPYPSELHRIGPSTARDKAVGLYDLHDRVQVNFEGRWIDSEVISTLGMEYQVTIPGNRVAWAKLENLRYVGPSVKPAAPKAGVPPKPGMTSCAGKIEGRYATTGSAFASFTVTFRSGKATMTDVGGNEENFECWIGGDKIYLRKPENPNLDMPIDINNDGTLQTPVGEIKKKGN